MDSSWIALTFPLVPVTWIMFSRFKSSAYNRQEGPLLSHWAPKRIG